MSLGNFVIQGLKGPDRVVVAEDLSPADKEIISMMLEPGGPLWKIVRAMVDFRDQVSKSLLSADLDDKETLVSIKAIQAQAAAVDWLVKILETAASEHSEEGQGNV